MRWIRTIRLRLRSLLRRSRLEDELGDELSYHFDRLVDEYLSNGMTREQAHQTVRREMGTIDQAKESCRDARGLAWLDSLRQDLRDAVRVLTRERGFAITAVVFIGCAIGANAALFSLADGLVLRPLPVPHASQVVTISTRAATNRISPYAPLSYPDYLDFVEANRSFASLTAFTGVTVGFARDRQIQPHLERGLAVSANFFETLQVTPQLGRGFHASEALVAGVHPVIVLADDTWRTEWGGRRDVIGSQVLLNGLAFDIIGVAPASFTGVDLFVRPAFYIPVTMESRVVPAADPTWLTNRERRVYTAKGRLQAGVSLPAARDEAERLFTAFEQSHPKTNRGIGGAIRTELQSRLDEDALTRMFWRCSVAWSRSSW